MATTPENDSGEKKNIDFKLFAAKRIVLGLVGIVLLLWLVSFALSFFDGSESDDSRRTTHVTGLPAGHEEAMPSATDATAGHGPAADHDQAAASAVGTQASAETAAEPPDRSDSAAAHGPSPAPGPAAAPEEQTADAAPAPEAAAHGAAPAEEAPAHGADGHAAPVSAPDILGVAFVNAIIAPISHELNERFYGWRANDIIEWTDNVNNYQLGVLEVTRRTAEVLADRISRTGSTQAFEKDLERARSNFNINADQYWLPSAETSYAEAIELLENYRQKLINGTALFYNRTDNLIPLLRAYENLLGSCDDNLVKAHEDDGSEVSWFKADNYFFYAKGVAAAMHSVMEAVGVDFAKTIDTRRGTEVLHHAIEALHHATEIDPLIVFDSAPDSLLANHRANMAAPISHARFYIGLLIETLST